MGRQKESVGDRERHEGKGEGGSGVELGVWWWLGCGCKGDWGVRRGRGERG